MKRLLILTVYMITSFAVFGQNEGQGIWYPTDVVHDFTLNTAEEKEAAATFKQMLLESVLELNADKSIVLRLPGMIVSGTWEKQKDKFVFQYTGQEPQDMVIKTLDADKMVLYSNREGVGATFYYSKTKSN